MNAKAKPTPVAQDPPAATPRYSTLNARERQINEDYEWCLHDLEICKQYGGQVVVAHRKRILGAGKNHMEALRAAARTADFPAKHRVAVVVVPEAPLS